MTIKKKTELEKIVSFIEKPPMFSSGRIIDSYKNTVAETLESLPPENKIAVFQTICSDLEKTDYKDKPALAEAIKCFVDVYPADKNDVFSSALTSILKTANDERDDDIAGELYGAASDIIIFSCYNDKDYCINDQSWNLTAQQIFTAMKVERTDIWSQSQLLENFQGMCDFSFNPHGGQGLVKPEVIQEFQPEIESLKRQYAKNKEFTQAMEGNLNLSSIDSIIDNLNKLIL